VIKVCRQFLAGCAEFLRQPNKMGLQNRLGRRILFMGQVNSFPNRVQVHHLFAFSNHSEEIDMKKALALAAVAGLASMAVARPDPSLKLELSNDNGTTWTDDTTVLPGASSVLVRVIMSVPDSFYGLSGARYNIISAAGQWDVGGNDVVDLTPGKGNATDGRVAGFDFGGQTQQIFETSNRLRIDAKGDTGNSANAGISTRQNTPGALGGAFNTNKTAVVYRFAINLANRANGDIIDLTAGEITSFSGYESQASSSGTQIANAVGDSARITVIPAPASLALVGLAGIAAGRRRR
jgi:hypothetical protein